MKYTKENIPLGHKFSHTHGGTEYTLTKHKNFNNYIVSWEWNGDFKSADYSESYVLEVFNNRTWVFIPENNNLIVNVWI